MGIDEDLACWESQEAAPVTAGSGLRELLVNSHVNTETMLIDISDLSKETREGLEHAAVEIPNLGPCSIGLRTLSPIEKEACS